jgi:hypothetical protein
MSLAKLPAHRTGPEREVPEAPRWIIWLAWATPLCVLPSSLWRVHAITQIPDGCPDSAGTDVYVVGLSIVSLTAAFLTVGLVSPWGQRLPTWLPHLGGRPVRPRAVLAAACVGVLILTAVYLYAVLNPILGWKEANDDVPGCPPPGETDGAWLAYSAYAPLLAWLPLLAIVTADFYRRTIRRP